MRRRFVGRTPQPCTAPAPRAAPNVTPGHQRLDRTPLPQPQLTRPPSPLWSRPPSGWRQPRRRVEPQKAPRRCSEERRERGASQRFPPSGFFSLSQCCCPRSPLSARSRSNARHPSRALRHAQPAALPLTRRPHLRIRPVASRTAQGVAAAAQFAAERARQQRKKRKREESKRRCLRPGLSMEGKAKRNNAKRRRS